MEGKATMYRGSPKGQPYPGPSAAGWVREGIVPLCSAWGALVYRLGAMTDGERTAVKLCSVGEGSGGRM